MSLLILLIIGECFRLNGLRRHLRGFRHRRIRLHCCYDRCYKSLNCFCCHRRNCCFCYCRLNIRCFGYCCSNIRCFGCCFRYRNRNCELHSKTNGKFLGVDCMSLLYG